MSSSFHASTVDWLGSWIAAGQVKPGQAIKVDDAPFVAIAVEVEGEGEAQVLRFTTNVEETAEAGPEHPIRVEIDPVTQEPAPYVHVRTNLEALIHRNVFYQLVELAVSREIDGQRWLGVWSGGEFFRIGLEP